MSLKRYELYAETKIEHGKKILLLTSALRVCNKLNIPYHISVQDTDSHHFKAVIQPDETKSLPFDQIRGTLEIRPDDSEIAGKILTPNLITTDSKVHEINCGNSFVFAKAYKVNLDQHLF